MRRIPDNHSFLPKRTNQGVSFFEVMVTVTILSVGLIAIYRSFFISLNYTRHLNYRLYAINLLDEKMASIEKDFIDKKTLPTDSARETKTLEVDHKPVDYEYTVNFHEVDGAQDLIEVSIVLSWFEGDKPMNMKRSLYISNYRPVI